MQKWCRPGGQKDQAPVTVTMLFSIRMTPFERATPLTSTAAFSSTAPEPPQPSTSVPRRASARSSTLNSALLKGCGAIALPLMLSACSWSWFGLNSSAPRVASHPTGSLSVAPARDFDYVPARSGRVSPNRIENTAMTGIVLKEDVNGAVRNGVANSLQIAGFRLNDHKRVLSGSIEAFSVDDTRSPAFWTLKMRYVVTDTATRKVVFSTIKTVKQKSPKFTSSTIAIEDTVKLSVDALIGDPGFVKAVN
jgi:hypothetical protein